MATVSTGVDTGLIAATFACLRNARVDAGAPVLDTFMCLATDLTDREAVQLPLAVEQVLPLLQADPDRFSLALDVALSFDLFEVAPSLLRYAETRKNVRALLVAASLATSPGIDHSLREALIHTSAGLALSEDQRIALRIRIDPKAHPHNSMQASLHAQRWPGGLAADSESTAPIVAIDEFNAPARLKWLVMADLRAAGAALRRIPQEWRSTPPPEWLSPRTPIITWSPEAFGRIQHHFPAMAAEQLIVLDRSTLSRFRALNTLAQRLPSNQTLRIQRPLVGDQWKNPLDQDVYRLGSFDAHEMAILSGTRRPSLYTTFREVLPKAQSVGNAHYWTFNQLVGLRSWQYFRQISGTRNLPPTIITRLVEFAGAPNPTSVGVTADGHVLRRSEDIWMDVLTGQVYLEQVRTLDEVFSPFELGAGQVDVPGLLRPSDHSKVHPAAVGGSPLVEGTRIPVRAVAEVVRDQDDAYASRAYGLSAAVTADVAALGSRLLYA